MLKIFPSSKGKLRLLDCYFPFAEEAGVYRRWSLEALKAATELRGEGLAGRRRQLSTSAHRTTFVRPNNRKAPGKRGMDADVGRGSVISAPALIALAAAVAAAV